jgi:hypothetical protein
MKKKKAIDIARICGVPTEWFQESFNGSIADVPKDDIDRKMLKIMRATPAPWKPVLIEIVEAIVALELDKPDDYSDRRRKLLLVTELMRCVQRNSSPEAVNAVMNLIDMVARPRGGPKPEPEVLQANL